MKPDTPEVDSQLDLKKRARRRLLGAAFFVIIVAAILPLLMDAAPPPQLNDFRLVTEDEKRAALATPVVVPPAEVIPAAAAPAAPAVIQDAPGAAIETKPIETAASAPAAPVVVAAADAKPAVPVTPVVEKKVVPAKPVEKPVEKPAEKKAVEKVAEKTPDKKPADKPTDAKKESKDSKEPVQTGQYFIQVGVFADADNVKQVRSKLLSQGIASWSEAATGNLAGKTRVKAGPFASKEAADKAMAKITKAGLNGLVVKK
ncbi:MAG: SPOR domain-containing protein [Fluviibacter sp.]